MVMEVDEPASTSMDTSEPLEPSIEWRFSQVKGNIEGDDTHTEADVISCVEFSHDGEYLATGDKGGRVVIFQRDQSGKYVNGARSREYNVYSTFQSHEPEFDYLKSLEIEEKINQIKWLKKKNAANFVLSTNGAFVGVLQIPTIVPMELIVEASPRRVYGNAHTYHVNSISVNSDQETFLSADDLRINLWHHEITNESFSRADIVDIKPTNMEELTEVITAAEFHPSQCNWFVYSSSKGSIRLCDMRDRALCDNHAKIYEEVEDPSSRSFFSEIIASVSDIKFSHNGRYLLTRDYLTIKVCVFMLLSHT
uniref:Serine/threonine-protein phosphatase 2A 55 kDa regulatory subunit B n=1 Tax=Angiostrongylus cantonensis TaxID=6313 RepID=A0A0K0DFR8_ANGCA